MELLVQRWSSVISISYFAYNINHFFPLAVDAQRWSLKLNKEQTSLVH